MPTLLFHRVIGDHPMFWVIAFGFFALVAVVLYFVIRLTAGWLARRGKK